MKGFLTRVLIFILGGGAYNGLEILIRGYTHWSMFLAGGLCFLLLLECFLRKETWSLWKKCLAGGGIITGVEFLFGCIFNLWLGMDVWDYSCYRIQLLGQISLLTSGYWAALSGLVAVALDTRHRLVPHHSMKAKPVQGNPKHPPTQS